MLKSKSSLITTLQSFTLLFELEESRFGDQLALAPFLCRYSYFMGSNHFEKRSYFSRAKLHSMAIFAWSFVCSCALSRTF